jgi:hypothetical protein
MDMDNMWEKIKKNFKEGAAVSIEKIEEYSKIGKLKIEEFTAKKKIEKNCVDIGERVYDLMESGKAADVAVDPQVKKGVDNIRSLNQDLAAIDQKMKAIAEDARKAGKGKTAEPVDPAGV